MILCAGCGTDLGNGSIFDALLVSDVVDDVVETLYFCRDRDAPDVPGAVVCGCAPLVKRPEVLNDYLARNPTRDGMPYARVTPPAPDAPPSDPIDPDAPIGPATGE